MKKEMPIEYKILITLGSIALVGTGILLARKNVQQVISNKEERKSLTEGSEAAYAKKIKLAIENEGYPGTDMEALRVVLREIPNLEVWAAVEKSFEKNYHTPMARDLSDNMQAAQYTEVMAIRNSKPAKAGQKAPLNYDNWARRLKAAFDTTYYSFPETDEDSIKAVFLEIPTQSDFAKVVVSYRRLYNNDLMDDLKSELEFWEFDDYWQIIAKKPK